MTLYLETKALETISEDLAYDNADAEEVAEEIRNGKSEETEQEGNWQGEDPRKLLEQELGIGLLQLVLITNESIHAGCTIDCMWKGKCSGEHGHFFFGY